MSTGTHCGVSLTCATVDGRKICRSGKTLPVETIAAAAIGAGFKPAGVSKILIDGKGYSEAAVATAIALAESGGDPFIIGFNTNGTKDVGLWQINDIHGIGCDRMRPDLAAEAAFKISAAGMTFSPWVAYKSGSFKKYLQEAEAAVSKDPRAPEDWDEFLEQLTKEVPIVGGVLTTADRILKIYEFLSDLIGTLLKGETWVRVAQVVGGLLLVALGIYYVTQESS